MDDIDIGLRVTGAEEGASSTDRLAAAIAALSDKVGLLTPQAASAGNAVDRLANRERLAADSARALAAQQQAAVNTSIQFTQRVAGAASAVQSLAAAFGTQGGATGLIARVAQSTAAFAQLGATFGPQGALVGGIVGALIPAIEGITGAQREAEAAAAAHATELRRVGQAAEDAAQQLRDFRSAGSRLGRARAAVGDAEEAATVDRFYSGDVAQGEGATAVRVIQERIGEIEAAQRALAASAARAGSGGGGFVPDFLVGQADGPVGAGDSADLVRARAALSAAQERANRDRAEADRSRRGGGGGGGESAQDRAEAGNASYYEALQRADEQRATAEAARIAQLEREKDMVDELQAAERARAEALVEGTLRAKAATEEAAEATRTAAMERMQLQQQADNALMESNRQTADIYAAQVQSYQQVTGVIVGGLTDALSSIISGQKSAEEAFLSLLASFLQFISEQAAIKAAFEFAEAVASIPAAPLVASHLAAGLAFTAVAVAAGAGSAVAGQAAAQSAANESSKPAAPESKSDKGGGGGPTVINWNAPIYTSSQKAEIGRELRSLVRTADLRFGG